MYRSVRLTADVISSSETASCLLLRIAIFELNTLLNLYFRHKETAIGFGVSNQCGRSNDDFDKLGVSGVRGKGI